MFLGQFGDFVENLGPGQLVGRQVLGAACLGEIQLGISDKKGSLEVEVIRAKGLVQKTGAKILPGEAHCKVSMKNNLPNNSVGNSFNVAVSDPFESIQIFYTITYLSKKLQLKVDYKIN